MSKSEQIKLKCDKCGKEYEATMWHSINVDLNPDLREKFLDNSLFLNVHIVVMSITLYIQFYIMI